MKLTNNLTNDVNDVANIKLISIKRQRNKPHFSVTTVLNRINFRKVMLLLDKFLQHIQMSVKKKRK